MKIGYDKIKTLAILYAVVPVMIFFIGWLNIISALIFIALSTCAIYFFLKNNSPEDGQFQSITLSKHQIIGIAAIAFIWCFAAGQGSFIHQSGDHIVRNAIFRDIISQKWPVAYHDGNSMLCYYIAHWMVPAVIGKFVLAVSGSAFAGYFVGNIALLLWSSFGCFIIFMLVAMLTNTGNKQRVFIAITMFIFFSGLDIVGALVRKDTGAVNGGMHLEWWGIWYQFSSNMTCLYWVYNQTIVPWMLLLCLMNEKSLKNTALIAILILPYGPFPFVGTLVLCFVRFFEGLYKSIKNKSVPHFIEEVLTPQNLIGMVAIAPVYLLYYRANVIVAGEGTGFRLLYTVKQAFSSDESVPLGYFIRMYLSFILLEFGLYMAFILKRVKPDASLIGMGISLLFIPLFQLGTSYDFSMRVSIPALAYVCVTFIQVIMRELPDWGEYGSFNNCVRHKKFLVVALLVFALGAATPLIEIKRELFRTITTSYSEIMDYFTNESLQSFDNIDNFAAANYKESDFYRILSKKRD